MFDSTNRHCLESIVRLSESRAVAAADDIYDEHGTMLWAKGKPVGRELQERLLQRKLKRPLETSLLVDGAVTVADLHEACRRAIDESPMLQRIGGTAEGRAALGELPRLSLPPAVRLLLTTVRENHGASYQHMILTLALSAGLAGALRLPGNDAQTLLLAALLHDLGEIYINPAYFNAGRRLEPSEWKHVASHPRVGQLLIQQMTPFPAEVAAAVGHHHERLDGSGYPFQVRGEQMSATASRLAVADSVAAILARGGDGVASRVGLALRIVPEEFDRAAVGVVVSALRGLDEPCACAAERPCMDRGKAELAWIGQALEQARVLAGPGTSPLVREIALAAWSVLNNVGKALRASGALDAEALGESDLDPVLVQEICMVMREVEWRMRNLARNVHLRAESLAGGDALNALSGLIAALDGEVAAG